tara:strand:+ start:23531 stop:23731 length:201 start_codon:yes stop_codon:yes gene_type:complete
MGCSKCEGETEGWKCEMCGSESGEHVADHQCGGEHCIPKCKGCAEAESKCTCGSAEETGEESESSE